MGRWKKRADYVYYAGFALFAGFTCIKAIYEKLYAGRIFISLHFIWYAGFILLAISSVLWAHDASATLKMISRLVQILVISVCVIDYADSRANIERALTILLLSFIVMSVYILVSTPFSQWFSGFIGRDVTGKNTNEIGAMASTGVLIALYKAYIKREWAFYAMIPLPALVGIMTSSKRSLFLMVGGLALLVFLHTKKRFYVVRIIIALAVASAALAAVIKIPVLYESVGKRVVSMFDFFLVGYTKESSLLKRQLFIETAKGYFYEHPLVGIGLNNFRVLIVEKGFRTYSHNNYLEIASGLGVAGLVAYYWFYVRLLVALFRRFMKGSSQTIIFITLIVLQFIVEYGSVSYYNRSVQVILALGFAATAVNPSLAGSRNNNEGGERAASGYNGQRLAGQV